MAKARAIKSHCQGLQLIMSQADRKKIKCNALCRVEKTTFLIAKLPLAINNQAYRPLKIVQ
jgi:hypothetical protein